MPIQNRDSSSGAIINFEGASDREIRPYAAALAKLIHAEMQTVFESTPKEKATRVKQSWPKAPSRNKRRFQRKQKLKEKLIERQRKFVASIAPAEAKDDKPSLGTALCVGCLTKVIQLYIERDHITSSDEISTRENSLLEFLNMPENKTFSKVLLKQKNMSLYFKENKNNIELTDEESQSAYNAQENLWGLCRDCNIRKSNQDVLEWFKSLSHFGKDFYDHVKKNMLFTGIIIPRVHPKKKTNSLIKIGKREIMAFVDPSSGVSLMDVAIKWVLEHHPGRIKATHKVESEISSPLKSKLDKNATLPKRKRAKANKKMADTVDMMAAILDGHNSDESSDNSNPTSREESPTTKEMVELMVAEAAKEANRIRKIVDKIKNLIKEKFDETTKSECFNGILKNDLKCFNPDEWKQFHNGVLNIINSQEKSENKKEALLVFFRQKKQMHNERQRNHSLAFFGSRNNPSEESSSTPKQRGP